MELVILLFAVAAAAWGASVRRHASLWFATAPFIALGYVLGPPLWTVHARADSAHDRPRAACWTRRDGRLAMAPGPTAPGGDDRVRLAAGRRARLLHGALR